MGGGPDAAPRLRRGVFAGDGRDREPPLNDGAPLFSPASIAALFGVSAAALPLFARLLPKRPLPGESSFVRLLGGAAAGLFLFAVLTYALRAADPTRQAATALAVNVGTAVFLASLLPKGVEGETGAGGFRRTAGDFCRGVIAYLLVLPGTTALNALNRSLGGGPTEPPEALLVLGQETPDLRFWLVLATIVVAVPCFEEFFARGLVQTGAAAVFRGRYGPRTAAAVAVVFASLVFTALHEPASYLPVFALSLVLGAIAARTGGTAAAVGFHAAHNAYAVAYERWLKAWLESVGPF